MQTGESYYQILTTAVLSSKQGCKYTVLSDYNQRRYLEGFKTSQTDLHPQVRRGSLIHTLREDGDQNLKMFFFSALQALAYSVWIINKVRVQYPQASFLDLLLMDFINLLKFRENFFLLLMSTFNPHEIIF